MTDLPATELKYLNRSWNYAPTLSEIMGAESNGYDKGQRAYVINKTSRKISFSLEGSEANTILNPCFVIKNWGSEKKANIRINGEKKNNVSNVKQGIIRDTDGTLTAIIWIEQKSEEKLTYSIF